MTSLTAFSLINALIQRWLSARDLAEVQAVAREMYPAIAGLAWQDISTAPKDGTCVLLFVGNRLLCEPFYCVGRYVRGRWEDAYEGIDIVEPTCWLPLPPPDAPTRRET